MENNVHFCHYDPDTFEIIGYYTPAVHPQLPEPNYELTTAQWIEAVEINANRINLETGELYHVEVEPSIDEKIDYIKARVQRHMDAKAQEYGYDNVFTAATYADEPTVLRFQQEGIAFRSWRSQVWEHCYGMLDDWQQGLIPEPTVDEVIASLPTLPL